jgi:hypothetical protein
MPRHHARHTTKERVVLKGPDNGKLSFPQAPRTRRPTPLLAPNLLAALIELAALINEALDRASEALVMISAADRARQAQTVAEIFDLMRKYGLALDDLIQIGGQDLKSPNPKQVAKAHHVEKTWALKARLSVKFADLEQAPGQPKPVRRRPGEELFSEIIENKEISGDTPHQVKSLKTNNKTDDHSVEVSRKGRWKHKRQLIPAAGGTP